MNIGGFLKDIINLKTLIIVEIVRIDNTTMIINIRIIKITTVRLLLQTRPLLPISIVLTNVTIILRIDDDLKGRMRLIPHHIGRMLLLQLIQLLLNNTVLPIFVEYVGLHLLDIIGLHFGQ